MYIPLCLECRSRVCHHVIRPRNTVTLTYREVALLVLLSRGLSNKELSEASGLTYGTVKVYLSYLFPKIGATSRLEAALWALKNIDLLTGTEVAA